MKTAKAARINSERIDGDMKIGKDYFRGCLVGGAVGDAKGYNVREGDKDLISDNTQLTSFTVDALIWADQRAKRKGVYAYIPCLFYSYQKWYYTQTGSLADKSYEFILDGEILKWEELYARRGEGTTTLNALGGSIHGKYGSLKNMINTSKGCGSVMRAAPIGMYFCKDAQYAFQIGCDSAALTHGHIDAILSTGYFAYVISGILQGGKLNDVALSALAELKKNSKKEDCYETIKRGIMLASEDKDPVEAMKEIGQGWTADEAMALAIYCSLKYENDYEQGVTVATSYDGNVDSIGSITGNILGANLGSLEVPYNWIKALELSELIMYGADRLLEAVIDE